MKQEDNNCEKDEEGGADGYSDDDVCTQGSLGRCLGQTERIRID